MTKGEKRRQFFAHQAPKAGRVVFWNSDFEEIEDLANDSRPRTGKLSSRVPSLRWGDRKVFLNANGMNMTRDNVAAVSREYSRDGRQRTGTIEGTDRQ